MDYALELPFSERVREITAEEFSRSVFRDALGIRGLVLGHDTTTGKNREGDQQRLTELGHEHGYVVRVIGEVMSSNEVVSSTRIRQALEAGDLEFASNMLGRPVSLLGKVVRGDGRGKSLGFATANLDLEQEACPRNGVYAARVQIDGDPIPRMAVCNIGTRPTFDRGEDGRPIVEAHLLDFSGDLYGKHLELIVLKRLRDERRFPGKDALVAQINTDVRQARTFLEQSAAH